MVDKLLSNVKGYFETHAHSHAYHSDPQIYDSVCELIRSNTPNNNNILDIGCGDGSFIKRAKSIAVNCNILGTDVSLEMIRTAQKNLEGVRTDLIVCDAFNLPIRADRLFDFIHIDSVLHHLIDRTIKKSLNLVRELLQILKQRLTESGILIIQEVYCDSYVVPSLGSGLIFYGLKFLNFAKWDISPIVHQFQLGLEVNFMQIKQIGRLLDELGGIVTLINKIKWQVPLTYRMSLVKEHGHITYTFRTS